MKKNKFSNYDSSFFVVCDSSRGFIAFTSLLVISAVTLAISISISLLGVNEARNSLEYKKSQESFYIAKACIEEGVYRIKLDPSFTGASLNAAGGVCTISVSGTGNVRTISAQSQISSGAVFVKKIDAQVQFKGGGAVLKSWVQVP